MPWRKQSLDRMIRYQVNQAWSSPIHPRFVHSMRAFSNERGGPQRADAHASSVQDEQPPPASVWVLQPASQLARAWLWQMALELASFATPPLRQLRFV